jgi:hypothetical protein
MSLRVAKRRENSQIEIQRPLQVEALNRKCRIDV